MKTQETFTVMVPFPKKMITKNQLVMAFFEGAARVASLPIPEGQEICDTKTILNNDGPRNKLYIQLVTNKNGC